MKQYQERPVNYEELPLVLSITHIEKILGISQASAYALVHSKGFPKSKLGERMIRVSKRSFFKSMPLANPEIKCA